MFKDLDLESAMFLRTSKELLAISEDFDLYRQIYNKLSFPELQEIHRIWAVKKPIQRHYDLPFFSSCFNKITSQIGDKFKVVELGGHDGSLAHEILQLHPKLSWLNIEIIKRESVDGSKNFDYRLHVLSNQVWLENLDISGCVVFISSHTLEHLTNEGLQKFYDYLKYYRPKFLVLQIGGIAIQQRLSWNKIKRNINKRGIMKLVKRIMPSNKLEGYRGSHLLTLDSKQIKKLFSSTYELITEKVGWCTFWKLHNR